MGDRLDYLNRFLQGRRNGDYKHLTKDCGNESCEWYREVEEEKICGWGTNWKCLIEVDNSRKCGVRNMKLIEGGTHSVERIDEIVGMSKEEFWETVSKKIHGRKHLT